MASRDRRHGRVLRDLVGPDRPRPRPAGGAGSRRTSATSAPAGSATGTTPRRRTPTPNRPPYLRRPGSACRCRRSPRRSPPPSPGGRRGQMAPRKVARLLTPLLADADLGRTWSPASPTCRRATSCSSRGVPGRPGLDHQAAHRPRPRCTCSDRTTGSPPSVVLRAAGRRPGSSWSGAATRYLASKPAAPDEAAYPVRADLRTLARADRRRPGGRGDAPGPRWATTTRCSPVPTSTRTGRPSYVPDGVVAPITRPLGRRGAARRRQRPGAGPVARPRRRTSPRTCARPACGSAVHRSRTGRATGADARRPGAERAARRRSSSGC